jgi:hypothetical protein
MAEVRKLLFVCCFCGQHDPEVTNGLALVDKESGDFIQQWWCHFDCLEERMVAEARQYPEPHPSDGQDDDYEANFP